MDHDMDMDMGGMSMGGGTMFSTTNMELARLYWYLVAAVVALCTIRRVIDILRTSYAIKTDDARAAVPSRPTNWVSQTYDTIMTLSREMTYPMLRPFTGSFTRYFSILPLGQTLLLLAYWSMILIMLWSNVILTPSSDLYGYKWEIVGFRAAWISVTQIPLIYCLGGKANVISLLTGISYERLNWLHRWTARTIFLTVIIHWSYFFREWWLADFIQDELTMMPMIKYGFGAWAVIGWSVLTGFGFFRTKSYELWLLQHLGSIAVLLWLLYIHVPASARYNIWLSIAFVAFDRVVRGAWSVMRNLHLSHIWKKASGNQSLVGYDAEVKCHSHDYISLKVKNVNFSWRPGQHVFISMPTCGIFESHPFTIANLSESYEAKLELYLKCHSGFTGRLRKKMLASSSPSIRTFVSGPWGNPPTAKIEICNTLIFVASSTGASFTVPLLEHAVSCAKFVRRLSFYWIIRHEHQLEFFLPRISAAIQSARSLNIEAHVRIFITASTDASQSKVHQVDEISDVVQEEEKSSSESQTSSEDSTNSMTKYNAISGAEKSAIVLENAVSGSESSSIQSKVIVGSRYKSAPTIVYQQGRPKSWDDLLNPTLEEAEGETAIVACGGGGLMADIRNYVAWISDQRAVHKGTGAQGIYLFTETYGW